MNVYGMDVSTAPKRGGFFIRYGDVCNPLDGEQLNGPPWPTMAWRFSFPELVPMLGLVLLLIAMVILTLAGHWVWAIATVLLTPLVPGVFICVRLPGEEGKRLGFYVGWKVYGFDSPTYAKWCDGIFAADVYDGSLAMEPTIRTFTDG